MSHQEWEKIECNADSHIPLVVLGVQATEHQIKCLDDRKPAQAVDDHEGRVETKLPEWLQPFTEGLTRGSSSSTDVSPPDVTIPSPAIPPSPHPPAKPTSNISRGKRNLFSNFPKGPNYEGCRRTKVTRTSCKVNLGDRTDRIKIVEDLVIWSLQTTRFLMKSNNLDCITDVQWSCKTWRGSGFKVIHAKPNQLRRRREVSRSIYTDNSLFFFSLRWTELESWEINSAQIRNTWQCRTSCTTSERRNFVSIGSVWTARKLMDRSHAAFLLFLKYATSTCRGQTPYERRVNHQKTKVEYMRSTQKSFLEYSWDTPWTRGEVGLTIFG